MRLAGPRLFTGEGIVPGHVLLGPQGRVRRVQVDEPDRDPDLHGLVAPAPTNAHTHLGDRLAREKVETEDLSIEEAVAPPDGLKHRILRGTPTNQLVDGMRRALREAQRAGVRRVLDFRESGPEGARALREAAQGLPVDVLVLGRPSRSEHWDEEKDLLVDLVDGIGISGLEDQPPEVSRSQADWARANDKRLALHLSEARREDLDAALDVAPDLLVHATKCTDEDVRGIAEADVPVAACPRANALFGNRPPLASFLEAGLTVGLGTDNAMFHEPDPFAEAAYVVREWPSIDPEAILAMACRFALGGEAEPSVVEGERVAVVDDRDGLRRGLGEARIKTPGRIDDE